jgi:hypothetical protein
MSEYYQKMFLNQAQVLAQNKSKYFYNMRHKRNPKNLYCQFVNHNLDINKFLGKIFFHFFIHGKTEREKQRKCERK